MLWFCRAHSRLADSIAKAYAAKRRTNFTNTREHVCGGERATQNEDNRDDLLGADRMNSRNTCAACQLIALAIR